MLLLTSPTPDPAPKGGEKMNAGIFAVHSTAKIPDTQLGVEEMGKLSRQSLNIKFGI
jgi:hypothetical protein